MSDNYLMNTSELIWAKLVIRISTKIHISQKENQLLIPKLVSQGPHPSYVGISKIFMHTCPSFYIRVTVLLDEKD
jgi:hypothetical protein